MSAYLLTDDHFAALVTAAFRGNSPVWYRNGKAVRLHGNDSAELFRMLKQANLDSVSARYGDPHEEADARDGLLRLSPVETLAACACFDYQACEVDNYADTDAAKTVDAIRRRAIMALPGFDDAGWGIPEGKARFDLNASMAIR